jgi:hypothetical protein
MLPTSKTPPKLHLQEYTVLLYGPPKIGKSEMCSQANGALFLETEPGLNSLEVFRSPISTWDDLLVAAKEIADGNHSFQTVVIDTVDNAYRMCADYVNKKAKVEHESDLEYGKGYSLVNSEFYRVMNKLALLPYGLFLISHSQDKEVEGRTGKSMKTVPTLPDKARKLILGLVDIVLFCDFEPTSDGDGKAGHRRVLRTKPTARYEAGDRTGRLPESIELNYQAFVAAFAQCTSRVRAATGEDAARPAPPPPSSHLAAPHPPLAGTASGEPTAAVRAASPELGSAGLPAAPPTAATGSPSTAPSAAAAPSPRTTTPETDARASPSASQTRAIAAVTTAGRPRTATPASRPPSPAPGRR